MIRRWTLEEAQEETNLQLEVITEGQRTTNALLQAAGASIQLLVEQMRTH